MKAIEQYFHVVLFIMLYKVVLTFKSVDETLVCKHSNESYRRIFVYNICLITISDTVSDRVTKKLILNIERAQHD